MQQKKSILQTCGHRLGQKDFSSPKSEQRRVKDMTSDRALASRAHSEVPTFLFLFYFSGFVSFRSVFSQFTHLFFCKATDSLQFLFWSSETNQQNKGMKPCGETKKKIKKRFKKKGQMLPFLRKSATLHRMKILLCYFQNSGIEQCCLVMFNLLYSVLMLFMDYLKPVCFMLIIYIFFLLYKKNRKEDKKRHNCSLSCTHTKKWILSQEGQGSRVPTPRHFNVHFYEFKEKNKTKKNKG